MATSVLGPGPGVPSPVYTPAVLQGELPPWAHPTPSPSPMMRCPNLSAEGLNRSPTAASKALLPQELLWSVCMPFVEQMISALHVAIEKQMDLLEAPRHVPQRRDEKVDPFHSLFNPSAGNLGRRALHRRGTPPTSTGEPLKEEPDEKGTGTSSSCPASPEVSDSGTAYPQKVALAMMRAAEEQPVEKSNSDRSHSHSVSAMAEDEGEEAAARPVYLAWQQQQQQPPGDNSGRSDPRLSPAAQPRSPEMPGTGSQLVLSLGRQTGEEDEAASTGGGGEKSAMVCRHWKSKGWCRMEDACKFLHPEHKRGATAPTRAEASMAGAVDVASRPPGETGPRTARRSRRSHRGRGNAGGSSDAADVTAVGAGPGMSAPAELMHMGDVPWSTQSLRMEATGIQRP